MNADEYTKLEGVEREHWFYAGKREIVFRWLRRLGALHPEASLVDVGAGTGYFAKEAQQYCQVTAVDDYEESLVLARKRLGESAVIKGSCTALPLPGESADIVTALDVIEHIADDRGAVQEMFRILKPGGVAVITVPAFQALWSDWDVVLHHQRRYRREPLLQLVRSAGFEVVLSNYVNVLAFPAVYAIRKLRAVKRGQPKANGERAEERIPNPLLNALLKWTFVAPACQTTVTFPFGVGLLLVARRPNSTAR
jgi:SAM-dependent methyltransferase